MIALLLGGFIGVAAAFGRKALQSGVDDPDLVDVHALRDAAADVTILSLPAMG